MTLQEFKPEGVTEVDYNFHESEEWNTQRMVLFNSELTGPKGAHYYLFQEPKHTKEDVDNAKQYIRANFDPVSITVIKETKL